MGNWENNSWHWKVEWTEPFIESETAADAEFLLLLEQVQPCREGEDRRRWIPNTVGVFSVKSAYTALQTRIVLTDLDSFTSSALKRLWKNNAPSKVIVFGWKLLLDMLPTREALFNKGILNNSMASWMNKDYITTVTVPQHFISFGDLCHGGSSNRICFEHSQWGTHNSASGVDSSNGSMFEVECGS
ncbi:hypothetical protein TSUD_60720 [Trifolium subterraneum]|uniref:Reverse transcriptase zinc-binding domain-containing protein n=1 Tax=Trifolium subterraneum TaxID=3900 RepID=A0A2Z6N995_TRISU|nr:hypothetical protein TSUD_60720 [Trifolium subterraneum]